MNTKQKGEFTVLIVESSGKALAVCPEFAIVKHGDSFEEVKRDAIKAAHVYLDAVRESKLPHELLNRAEELPSQYQILYEVVTDRIEKKSDSTSFKKLSKSFQQAINSGNASVLPVCV